MIDAVHDGVVCHTSTPDAIGNGDVKLVGLVGRENVGAQFCVLVSPCTVHHLDGMGGILGPSDEHATIGVGIHHHLPHVERCRHACLMIQQVAEGDILLVAVTQARYILTCLVIETELAVVIGFHHATDSTSGLGHRCEPKQCIIVNLDLAAVVNGAK